LFHVHFCDGQGIKDHAYGKNFEILKFGERDIFPIRLIQLEKITKKMKIKGKEFNLDHKINIFFASKM